MRQIKITWTIDNKPLVLELSIGSLKEREKKNNNVKISIELNFSFCMKGNGDHKFHSHSSLSLTKRVMHLNKVALNVQKTWFTKIPEVIMIYVVKAHI